MSPRTPEQFEEMREEKKEIILNTALKLFADKGYHATSISAIAKEAGISKGLMYNYFESKESLLIKLYESYLEMFMEMINPNHDDEISNEEMEHFLKAMVDSMGTDSEYWKLYIQMSLQKGVLQVIDEKIEATEMIKNQLALIYKYFAERFENPTHEMLFFSSILKGFSVQYVYAPEYFPQQEIDIFIDRVKRMFIVDKKGPAKPGRTSAKIVL